MRRTWPTRAEDVSVASKDQDAFRTISEVAAELDVPAHVLRFWETKFPQVKPLQRGGNRRYYRRDEIVLLQAIRRLLYGEGYTIKGVQRLLKDRGARAVVVLSASDGEREQQGAAALDAITAEPEMVVPLGSTPGTMPRAATGGANSAVQEAQLLELAREIESCSAILAAAREAGSSASA